MHDYEGQIHHVKYLNIAGHAMDSILKFKLHFLLKFINLLNLYNYMQNLDKF